MANILIGDDGTMDTVLYCQDCGREFRGNYDPTAFAPDDVPEGDYDAWVQDFITETVAEHVCSDDDDDDDDDDDA